MVVRADQRNQLTDDEEHQLGILETRIDRYLTTQMQLGLEDLSFPTPYGTTPRVLVRIQQMYQEAEWEVTCEPDPKSAGTLIFKYKK